VVIGGYLCFTGSVLGAACGPLANKFFSVKQLMVGGNFILAFFLGLVSLFTVLEKPYLVLGAIILF
jgi:hypothetical protein